MAGLRTRFGLLVASHRRRLKLTQADLAEAAGISLHTIQKIESGVNGARFPVIERVSDALGVDPSELFNPGLTPAALSRRPLTDLTAKLAALTDDDLGWVSGLLDAALRSRRP